MDFLENHWIYGY